MEKTEFFSLKNKFVVLKFKVIMESMEHKFFNHAATLGEIARFAFIMLGDFWNDCGLTSDLQRKYEEKDSTTNFSKYNLFDEKQDLAKGFKKFKEEIESYSANSMETIPLIEFPKTLLSGITELTLSYSEKRDINFSRVAKLYINYRIIYQNKKIWNHNSFQEMQAMVKETYSSIIKEIPALNFKEIAETATWTTIAEYLAELNENSMVASEAKKNVSARIVRHYLFLHFLKALDKVFEVDILELKDYYETADFNKILEEIECLLTIQKFEGIHPHPSIWYWIFPKKGSEKQVWEFGKFTSTFEGKPPLTEYFLNSNDVVERERANQLLRHLRNNWTDNPQTAFFERWFKARTEIFSLKFDNSKIDAKKIQEAQSLYKATFDNFKYIVGKNLQEFLFDAIAVETYFNQKQKKDILDNSQDDSNESSLTKQAKTYWEFAYAAGLLDENSKKTYLSAYNVAKNFWWAFPPKKFTSEKTVSERFSEEIQDEELNLPKLIQNFSDKKKIDNLLSKERKDLRQKIGKRYYSNLSIAIMKARTAEHFDRIHTYIKEMDAGKLAINDECGATPLMRALQEYKCCQLNHSPECRQKRGEILLQWNNEQEQINSHLCGNSAIGETMREKRYELGEKTLLELTETANEYAQAMSTDKNQQQALKQRSKFLKEKVIIPLIEKVPADTLLDEAIQLDASSCVSALQLAIDSFDADLVECILGRLSDNPLTFYISDEYTTPLQYAIRKCNFYLSCQESPEKCRWLTPVPKRKVTAGGIFDKEQVSAHYQNVIFSTLNFLPFETIGMLISSSDAKSKYESLIKTIHLLADHTNPISVDNFYYLIDQMDPQDGIPYTNALDLAKYLLETGHADLSMTDREWIRNRNFIPLTTILGYCIDKHNYPMLKLLLESQYTEQLKKIINLRLLFRGNENELRYQTDPLMFVQNMILNIKNIYQTDPEKYESYGKMTADRLHLFLPLFSKIGADFDLPDQDGKSIRDYLREWKDKFPEGAIPEFLGI